MSNVVSLFNRTQSKTVSKPLSEIGQNKNSQMAGNQLPSSESSLQDTQSHGLTFLEIAERNRVNQERLRKERELANKNVLKSYRIK
jgi:hypothetical protein